MPWRFVPPTAPLVPTTVRQNHPGHALFRYYTPWSAGINVFLLTDGTVTTVEPGDPELIDTTFHGGHIHTIDDDVADLLVAAGYTVQFITLPLPTPGLPSGDYTSPPVALPGDFYTDLYTDTYGAPGVASGGYVATYQEAYQ